MVGWKVGLMSIQPSILPPESLMNSFHTNGYGYSWWLEEYRGFGIEAFSARGHGLQFIVVLPSRGLVVVVTGGAWYMAPEQAPVQVADIIGNYILRALEWGC